MYSAIVMDLFSRRIVGWYVSKRITADLICKALIVAYNLRQPLKGLVFHSDHCSQYTSKRYQQLLKLYGIRSSMGDVGACWDNASFIQLSNQCHNRKMTGIYSEPDTRLIIFPDSNNLNRDSFTTTVRSLYRQGKVAIGFSELLVKAGAFAAVYANDDLIYQQLLNNVSQYLHNHIFQDPQYAKNADIAINDKLTRSLNISVCNKDDVLHSKLKRYTQ